MQGGIERNYYNISSDCMEIVMLLRLIIICWLYYVNFTHILNNWNKIETLNYSGKSFDFQINHFMLKIWTKSNFCWLFDCLVTPSKIWHMKNSCWVLMFLLLLALRYLLSFIFVLIARWELLYKIVVIFLINYLKWNLI